MESIYDQVEIEDFEFDPEQQIFTYPCPCGDKFQILLEDLKDGEDIAVCPTCSLMVQVVLEEEDLGQYLQDIQREHGIALTA